MNAVFVAPSFMPVKTPRRVRRRFLGVYIIGDYFTAPHNDGVIHDLKDMIDIMVMRIQELLESRAVRTKMRTPCVSSTPRQCQTMTTELAVMLTRWNALAAGVYLQTRLNGRTGFELAGDTSAVHFARHPAE
jgi:hypothetical protein